MGIYTSYPDVSVDNFKSVQFYSQLKRAPFGFERSAEAGVVARKQLRPAFSK